MKYIKKFENIENKPQVGDCVKINLEDSWLEIYYIIHIDGNWNKFLIALEKLNIKEEFFNDWNIKKYDDLEKDNQEYFKSDKIVLLYSYGSYIVRYNKKEIEREFTNFAKFGGEIYIPDYELKAKKYNL